MTNNTNQNPEQVARDRIDEMLIGAEWVVQSKNMVDLSAGCSWRNIQMQTGSGLLAGECVAGKNKKG